MIKRRGGCAKRNNKRAEDFEDFGLADTDFPHRRSPAMQSALVTNAAVTPVSPTIPRLNDQGNFYGGSPPTAEDGYSNSGRGFVPPYQPQLEGQPYYYQQQQQQQDPTGAGYYDDAGYYYEGQQQPMATNNMGNNTSYDMTQQYQPYNNTTEPTYSDPPYGTDQYYKPDQVDVKPHERM